MARQILAPHLLLRQERALERRLDQRPARVGPPAIHGEHRLQRALRPLERAVEGGRLDARFTPGALPGVAVVSVEGRHGAGAQLTGVGLQGPGLGERFFPLAELRADAAFELDAAPLEVPLQPDPGRGQDDHRHRRGEQAPATNRRIAPELVQQLGEAWVARSRRARQAPQQQLVDPPRHRLGVARRAELPGHDRLGQRRQRVTRERPLAIERLPERNAERELIGARVESCGPAAARAPCTPACRRARPGG